MPIPTIDPPSFQGEAPPFPVRSDGLIARLFAEIRRRPVRSLLIAAGTGYLSGGGLSTRFTARMLGTGVRTALRLAIVPLFIDALERALTNRGGAPVLLPPPNNRIHKEMHS
jgi:hypothetical protein